jgi:hypothetical protein
VLLRVLAFSTALTGVAARGRKLSEIAPKRAVSPPVIGDAD